MTRFLIAIVTLAFFTGCIAPTEQLTPFPEDAEGPSPEEEEAMRNFGNNNSFGTSVTIPYVQNGRLFSPEMSETVLNVDLSSILASENIDSEIVRVPGNWVLTMQTQTDYGSSPPSFTPLLATVEFGSGGARTSIKFNPSRFSQILIPATNVRVYVTWDPDLSPFADSGESVRVVALLQRSPFVENRASRVFGVTTLGGSPSGALAAQFEGEVPFGAKSWSFVGSDGVTGSIWDNCRLTFDGSVVAHYYTGADLLEFYKMGIDVPVKGAGERFLWSSNENVPAVGFIRFNL